jgi:hypothetical protein
VQLFEKSCLAGLPRAVDDRHAEVANAFRQQWPGMAVHQPALALPCGHNTARAAELRKVLYAASSIDWCHDHWRSDWIGKLGQRLERLAGITA